MIRRAWRKEKKRRKKRCYKERKSDLKSPIFLVVGGHMLKSVHP